MTLPERVRALSEAATAGPWILSDGDTQIWAPDPAGKREHEAVADVYRYHDAAFIVEAVNYVRSLASSQEPSLDPNRLARALHWRDCGCSDWTTADCERNKWTCEANAREMAAEYLRLSQSEGQELA